MTEKAKEILNKHFEDSIPTEFKGEIWDERLIISMNEYVLHIAGQSLKEEINEAHSDVVKEALNFYGGRVVDRIKTLTEQE